MLKRGSSGVLFWGVLALIMIFSLITIVSVKYEGNLIGKAVQKISYAQEGSNVLMSINNVDGINLMKIYFSDVVEDDFITVEQIEGLTTKFEGVKYSMFKISSKYPQKIRKLTLNLEVNGAKLNQLGVSKGDLRLYVNGGEVIPTLINYDKGAEGYLYYAIDVFNPGEFVVGKSTVKKPANQLSTVVKTPTPKPTPKKEELVIVKEKKKPLPLVGKAGEQKGFSSKLKSFFKNFFGVS